MTISISDLEAMERAMTPGEWAWDDEQERIEAPPGTADFGLGLEKVRNTIVETDNGVYPPRLPDAIGICAMRNAYPVLLAIAKAAMEYINSDDEDRSDEVDCLIAALKAVQP